MSPIELIRQKQIREPAEAKGGLTTFINPFSYLFYRKHLPLFRNFDYVLVDGIALVLLLKMVGVKTLRFSFDMTSLAPGVFENAIKNSQSIYIIGSTQESVEGFVNVIESNYKELHIVGFKNGFFKDKNERENTLNNIVTLAPDIVIVGMGTPLQEMFLVDLKKKGWSGSGYTCGGFIHQTVTRSNYYPAFFDKYNLRWLYRMFDEPKLIRRYLFLYPKSVLLFFNDFIKHK